MHSPIICCTIAIGGDLISKLRVSTSERASSCTLYLPCTHMGSGEPHDLCRICMAEVSDATSILGCLHVFW